MWHLILVTVVILIIIITQHDLVSHMLVSYHL